MKWEEFIKIVGNLPVIDTEILLAGVSDPKPLKVQISRWEKSGKLLQLKRGIYLLSEPYRKVEVFEPYIASILMKPSYISMEKALEFHNLIPEAVPVYTSLTTKRPAKFINKVGIFEYHYIKSPLFWGYDSVAVNKQTAFVASPEKALLDLFYIKGLNVSQDYITELRLQDLGKINTEKLSSYAVKFNKPGVLRITKILKEYIISHKHKEKTL